MNELNFLSEIAKVFNEYGVLGVVILFMGFLVWQDRQRTQRADKDREVLTNHLSGMIKENAESNKELAVSLNGLTAAVTNFQSRCGQIQTALQNEVDRLMKG